MNDPKVNITVMPGAQMNGYVKEQNNYFGTVQQIVDRQGHQNADKVEAEETCAQQHQPENAVRAHSEDLFRFIHPAVDTEEKEWAIHDEVKRLVTRQGVQEICQYLEQMKKDRKILLPQSPGKAYAELVRMGMPSGEGFNEKTFQKHYKN